MSTCFSATNNGQIRYFIWKWLSNFTSFYCGLQVLLDDLDVTLCEQKIKLVKCQPWLNIQSLQKKTVLDIFWLAILVLSLCLKNRSIKSSLSFLFTYPLPVNTEEDNWKWKKIAHEIYMWSLKGTMNRAENTPCHEITKDHTVEMQLHLIALY